MVFIGTFANMIAIIVGTAIGMIFTNIHEKYKTTIMQGVGLVVAVIGIQMAITTESIIIVLLSILIGAVIGETLKIEKFLNQFAHWIAAKFTNEENNVNVAQAFVTASLIFVVGAMAVLGSLDSGIRGDHTILLTKSILDGFTAIVLTSTLGFGVVLSIIPIFVVQGFITALAVKINEYIPELLLNDIIIELTATGGILIIAIGLTILKLIEIRIPNLLPALLIVVLLKSIQFLM